MWSNSEDNLDGYQTVFCLFFWRRVSGGYYIVRPQWDLAYASCMHTTHTLFTTMIWGKRQACIPSQIQKWTVKECTWVLFLFFLSNWKAQQQARAIHKTNKHQIIYVQPTANLNPKIRSNFELNQDPDPISRIGYGSQSGWTGSNLFTCPRQQHLIGEVDHILQICSTWHMQHHEIGFHECWRLAFLNYIQLPPWVQL